MSRKRWARRIALAVIVIAVWNFPLTYKIGIDGKLFRKKIPLYAKACGFLYRDWAYKELVAEIVGDKKEPLDKILAILEWTNNNVKHSIPPGLKTVDDHPLNIIIRQYGAGDQIEDVFTILSSYAGFKGGMKKLHGYDRKRVIILSFVRVNGRWLIFDVGRNKYFLNKNNGIGSVEDYLAGDMILSDEDASAYKEFLDDLKNVNFFFTTRAEEQMPTRRIQAQIKKLFKRGD